MNPRGASVAERQDVRSTDIPARATGRSEWDEFVTAQPDATFCHLSGWQEVMAEALGHECRYVLARAKDGSIAGVLPLVRVRSRMLGHYLLSMPFLNYGGPIGSPDAVSKLVKQGVEDATLLGVDLLELRTRHPVTSHLETSGHKVTVVLDLPADPERLWKDVFPSKLRSQIRRPQKAGMTVRFGPTQLEPFYEVFARNMRDLGTPVLPLAWFTRIVKTFETEALIAVVYSGEQPVAGGFGFAWRDEFEITWASSLREYNRESPNMLLYWSLMEESIRRGLGRFNFGRCTPDGSTHRFKRQWMGTDVPLPWLRWAPGGAASTPSPDRPIFRLATRAWQRLPVPVANRMGPALARVLP